MGSTLPKIHPEIRTSLQTLKRSDEETDSAETSKYIITDYSQFPYTQETEVLSKHINHAVRRQQ
jgi:hypothetical protein